MKPRRWLWAAVCLLGVAGSLRAADDAAVRELIRQARERLAAAQVRRDVPAMMEVYADNAVVFPPGEGPLSGKPAVARWRTTTLASARTTVRERFETGSLDVCGDLAVETGIASVQQEASGASPVTIRTPYMTVWKRQEDGSWKILKDMGNRGPGSGGMVSVTAPEAAASPVPTTTRAAAGAPLPLAAPSDFIPIPDARPLSDGFVRNIGDQIRARAAKIRSLEASNASEEVRQAAIRRADRELQVLIRDVGWIDVYRFGVPTACNAAFIVERSGDPALIKSAVPLMKDLQSNEESAACYRSAREAYERLPK